MPEEIIQPDPQESELLLEEESGSEDGAQQINMLIRRLLPTRRIDKYLKHRFPHFSRNIIQGLVEEEAIKVNGRAVKNSYQLKPGDRIEIILPPPPTGEITPENIPLNILYEDRDILVLNKPAGLIVHPARGNRGGTLVNGLVFYAATLSSVNGSFRPGIVHRLDRNTTGLMVVAKTDTAHWRLAHQFEHRQVQKTYLAVAHGTMDLDADMINLPLGRHPRVREKYAVLPDTGKEALTAWKLKKQFRGYALLDLLPKTGRTHQLRVHLSAVRHPIVGDLTYGGKSTTLEMLANGQPLPAPGEPGGGIDPREELFTRQMLHAFRLQLHHPITAQPLTFEAPPPPDMQLLIGLLERYRASAH